jgi:hypothetical protein
VHLPPTPRQIEGFKVEEVKRGEEEERRRGGEEFWVTEAAALKRVPPFPCSIL